MINLESQSETGIFEDWQIKGENMAVSTKSIFINGDFHTYDLRCRHAQALAVEDGRIIDIGGNARMRTYAKRGFSTIDLKRQCVIPGITDAHLHLLNLGEHYNRVNLDGVDSLKKVGNIITKAASRLKKGQWLLGRGWNIGEQRRPFIMGQFSGT